VRLRCGNHLTPGSPTCHNVSAAFSLRLQRDIIIRRPHPTLGAAMPRAGPGTRQV